MSLELKIFGTRGSLPNTSSHSSVFGGATSCYYVNLGDGHLIMDAGSGIVDLGAKLVKEAQPGQIDLFLTHFHYDHIIGLPFFAPLYDSAWQVRLWTSSVFGESGLDEALNKLFSTPMSPITRDILKADLSINIVDSEGHVQLRDDIDVSTTHLSHPGGNAAYKISHGGRTLVYSGDFEHGDDVLDQALVDFLKGVDIALLDCTYTPESYPACKGYGHAHWQVAGDLADAAGVKEWYGVHHEHMLDDISLLTTEAQMRQVFPNARLAREGETITL